MIKFCQPEPIHNFVSMKIEHHISQLLYRYQCVTVPGFGAFLTETQPAQLHEASNAFYPPRKVVSFNAYLKHNDGLLADHIARSEHSTYEAAVAAIHSEVGIWRNILEINQKFTLKNIGELSLNSEKNVVFSPYEQNNFLKEAFGLNSFVSPAIKRETYKEEVRQLEEKTPIALTEEKRNNYNWLKYTAVTILALTAAGTIGFKVYNNYVSEQNLLVEESVQQQVQEKIQEATFIIDTPVPSVTFSVREDAPKPYHIVAGAFRVEENAQKTYDELTKLGYEPRRLEPNKHGLHPVLYGSYSDYREAVKALSGIKKSHNPDAWLLIKQF